MRDIENEADELLEAVGELERTRRAVMRSVGYRAGVSAVQLRAMLNLLRSASPRTDTELSDDLQITRESARSIFASLERKGLIAVVTDVKSGPSQQAHAVVDPNVEPWNDLKDLEQSIDEAIGALNTDEVRAATNVLARVSETVHSWRDVHRHGVRHRNEAE